MQRSHLLAMRLFSFCDLHIIMEISLAIQTGSAAEAERERDEKRKKCVVIVVADSPPSALDPLSSRLGSLLFLGAVCTSRASILPPRVGSARKRGNGRAGRALNGPFSLLDRVSKVPLYSR